MKNQILLDVFAASLDHLKKALHEVAEEQACRQPDGVVNHPAWTITHLCVAHDFLLQMLGDLPLCPKEWAGVASPGSTPSPDRSLYPRLDEALNVLNRQHDRIEALIRNATDEQLSQPSPESIRGFAPTIGHVVAYMLCAHENYHLAQLNIWKRALAAQS